MKLLIPPFKLALVPLACAIINGCNNNSSDNSTPIEQTLTSKPMIYGSLNNTSAIIPATKQQALKNSILIQVKK